jgi:hypothetical protein
MPKRISKKLKDSNQIAAAVVALSTELPSPAIDPTPLNAALLSQVMAEMGRKGGKIGGKKSLETMTIAERKKRARKAAKTRWAKKKPKLG